MSNEESSEEEHKSPLISIDIQLPENQKATLMIMEEESIQDKINEFCSLHHLNNTIKELIKDKVAAQIENQINYLEGESQNEDTEKEEEEEEEEEDDEMLSDSNYNNNSNEERTNRKLNRIETSRFNAVQNDDIYNNSVNNNNNKRKVKANPNEVNGGERMYKQHKEKLIKKEANIKRIKQEKIDEEDKELSFHPKINKKSTRLAKSKEKVEDRLIESGLNTKKKNFIKQGFKDIKEINETTYHPSILKKSIVLSSIKKRIRLEEIPQSILRINTENIELGRNKSSDILTSKRNFESNNDNNSTIKSNQNSKTRPLDQLYSKYSFTNQKANKDNTELYNSTTFRAKSSLKDRNNTEKTSMTHKHKICKPEINPEKSLYDYLYIESKIINDKKEKKCIKVMKELCPFKPHISDNSKKLLKNKKETKNEFLNRIADNKKDIEQIKLSYNKNQMQNSKRKTTAPLFYNQKKLNKTNWNKKSTCLNERIYDKRLMKIKDENKKAEMCNTLEKKKFFLENSMKIILKMKFEKYKEIFNLLDSDHDGYISKNKIKLSNLDSELLETITPILQKLQSSEEAMSFKTFCNSIDKLLSVKIFQ